MNTLVSSSSNSKWVKAVIAAPLFITGTAGVLIGGPLWGLLGVAFVLSSVWWVTHTMQSAQLSREIERCYRSGQKFLPVAAAVTQRVTHSRHNSLCEFESVRG